MFLRYLEAWPLGPDLRSGTACQLTARRRVATDGLRNFLETDTKHVMQQECRTLEWGEALEGQHQGESHIALVGVFCFSLDYGLGQPCTDVSLALDRKSTRLNSS